MDSSPGPVIVGIDGSRDARCAVEWAITEAATLLTTLLVIAVVSENDSGGADQYRHSREALWTTEHLIRRERLAVPVTARILCGDPAEVLVQESGRAAVLCVGAGGAGVGHQVGPVAAAVVERARCSVAIIRPEAEGPDLEGVVAVVLDDDQHNDDVVHRAMQEGRQRGMTVRHIDRRVDSWVRRYPDVSVELVAMGSRSTHGSGASGLPTRLAVVDSADLSTITGQHDSAHHCISGFPYHCSILVVREGRR